MIQEAIKQLWGAKTRLGATKAIDTVERCLERKQGRLNDIQFYSFMALMKVKSRKLPPPPA